MERWQTSAEVTVYLQKGFDEEKQKALFETVKNFEGVLEPQWISEEQALVRFKTELGSQQSLLDGLKSNPLPASIEFRMDQVLVESPENLERLTGRIRSMEGVDDVQSGSEWVQRMALVKQGLMLLGLFLGAGLLVTVIFIISNTIKLMVYAREEEIEIMRLVGATESFIRAPFILEGMIQGFLGTLTAAVILIVVYGISQSFWNSSFAGLVFGMRIVFVP